MKFKIGNSGIVKVITLFDGENSEVNAFSILNEISRNLVILEENDKNLKFSEDFENISFGLKEIYTTRCLHEKIKNKLKSTMN